MSVPPTSVVLGTTILCRKTKLYSTRGMILVVWFVLWSNVSLESWYLWMAEVKVKLGLKLKVNPVVVDSLIGFKSNENSQASEYLHLIHN